MSHSTTNEAGSAATLTGLKDAKADGPAFPNIQGLNRWPAAFSAAWIVASLERPELLGMTCEALNKGGVR